MDCFMIIHNAKDISPNLTEQGWSKCHKMYLILSQKIEKIWIYNSPHTTIEDLNVFLIRHLDNFFYDNPQCIGYFHILTEQAQIPIPESNGKLPGPKDFRKSPYKLNKVRSSDERLDKERKKEKDINKKDQIDNQNNLPASDKNNIIRSD